MERRKATDRRGKFADNGQYWKNAIMTGVASYLSFALYLKEAFITKIFRKHTNLRLDTVILRFTKATFS